MCKLRIKRFLVEGCNHYELGRQYCLRGNPMICKDQSTHDALLFKSFSHRKCETCNVNERKKRLSEIAQDVQFTVLDAKSRTYRQNVLQVRRQLAESPQTREERRDRMIARREGQGRMVAEIESYKAREHERQMSNRRDMNEIIKSIEMEFERKFGPVVLENKKTDQKSEKEKKKEEEKEKEMRERAAGVERVALWIRESSMEEKIGDEKKLPCGEELGNTVWDETEHESDGEGEWEDKVDDNSKEEDSALWMRAKQKDCKEPHRQSKNYEEEGIRKDMGNARSGKGQREQTGQLTRPISLDGSLPLRQHGIKIEKDVHKEEQGSSNKGNQNGKRKDEELEDGASPPKRRKEAFEHVADMMRGRKDRRTK